MRLGVNLTASIFSSDKDGVSDSKIYNKDF